MGRKDGGCCALFAGEGELRPRLTQCIAWAEVYFHTKWHLDPFSHLATTDMGGKLGKLRPLLREGQLGPHLTPCGRGRGLPAWQASS